MRFVLPRPSSLSMTLEDIILRLQRLLEQRSSNAEWLVVERKKVEEMHDSLIKISRPSL